MLIELFRRIWFFLNRRHLERAIEEEMAFHREMMAREGRSGFGNTLRLREEARDAWGWRWVDHLSQDLQHAVRLWRRSPGFTVTAIAVLSLGIGGNTAMFSILHRTLLKPLPYRDPGRLVFARCTFGSEMGPFSSAPDYYDYREQADAFEGFSAILGMASRTTVVSTGGPERVIFTYVAYDLFRTLGVEPEAGRWLAADEGRAGGPDAILVSGSFAQRRFGGARNAVGVPLALNGKTHTIVGVMPRGFRFLDDVDFWLPMRRGEGAAGLPRQFHNWLIVGRLKPATTLEGARRQVDVISKRLERQYPDSNTRKALQLDPLQAALAGSDTPRLMVLATAAGLILLMACANVAGLLLARGQARRPELAMRAVLGASRGRITAQLLVESAALSVAAGGVGLLLASWLNRFLPFITGLRDPGNAAKGLEWPVLLFALGLSVAAGVLSGVAPALRASSRVLLVAPGARSTAASTGLRGALVAGQVAVSLILLAGAGLLIRSFTHLAGADLGFDANHLLTGEIQLLRAEYPEPDLRIRFFDGLREDLANTPGIESAGFISNLPIRNPVFNLPAWDADHPPASRADARSSFRRIVLPGYFAALRIPLLAGRDFSERDSANTPRTMIVNERMARTLFGKRNPLGRRVSMDMPGSGPVTCEVVGVAGDARLTFVGNEPPLTMYLSYYQFPDATMRFAVRSRQEPEALARSVRRLVEARDRSVPVEAVLTMEKVVSESLAPQRAMAVLLGLLAGFAVLLASIGLYGVLAYWVTQRTQEIGVRMALGATPSGVLRMVMKQGAALALIGIAAGIAGAASLTRLLGDLLYGVLPTDPLTFTVVPAVLLGVALLATWIPARRAARVDPLVALRSQ